ncbi:TraR/DksA C4-type zinc finger protein [Glycomyces sp. TRM65418]|uniref:TraR/DksA family transcriptional regulator n=1 Tax=Glycomyces sp. TRM65418 TaxID=2867006 RepID=UPI001CE54FEE|nr:TraR/DksA C4-type zinc finger protein [Glycomyces sp. TRM65418]MCC3762066.1 TraR/DksA C4-type zinc finger protein [Glycomyces sp. TRM65418]QZD56135.1 TraR/DksA C4-type zinc finger protein [Glycomyces sp. TRM65418]
MSPAKKTQKQAAKKAAAKKTAKPASESGVKPAAKKAVKAAKPEPAVAEETEVQQLRTETEQAELRAALKERLDELIDEQQRYTDSIALAQRERLSDTAGDDQIDSGSKTVEHEHEVAVAGAISERIRQVSHALERLDEGGYGFCEKCGKAIPAARLAAFPSATLCVSCKQLEERR